MAVTLNPYLSFRDTAEAALEHYKSVFGGEVTIMRMGDMGTGEASEANKVMHGQLTADGLTLMAADAPDSMDVDPNGAVSLSGDDDATLRGYWAGLSEGGTPIVPLEVAPWGDAFGMCFDKFGIRWMVNIAGAPQG